LGTVAINKMSLVPTLGFPNLRFFSRLGKCLGGVTKGSIAVIDKETRSSIQT
jgi:hypothetical protein